MQGNSEKRIKADNALFVADLLAEHYPQAEKVTLVQDNLNSHCYGSFFAALEEPRAWQLREQISFCFTPKHASWLNMAEIEFSALGRQRIGSIQKMKIMVEAWQEQ